jgi:hypothetical protein
VYSTGVGIVTMDRRCEMVAHNDRNEKCLRDTPMASLLCELYHSVPELQQRVLTDLYYSCTIAPIRELIM